jgi:hypothetical protein
MAAASNGGEERRAQIGLAVTRPIEACTDSVMVSVRCGHPAAARHSRHARNALASGTSRKNGVVRLAIQDNLDGLAGGQAVGILGHDHEAVGGREDRQQR